MSFSLPVLSISLPAKALASVGRLALGFLAASFIFYLLFFIFSGVVLAQSSAACEPNQTLPAGEAIDEINRCAIEKDVFDDKIFNFNQIAGTSDSLYTMLLGESLLHPETNEVTKKTGAVSAAGSLVAGLYAIPPVSGVDYFASQIQKFNPIQPAYAQAQTGIGFQALTPVKDIWAVFRNASYIGFVIIFVIIGFMIMFRAHVSPQAVATIQDSIPRLIIALVLVTFSYAIAGLMIDIMFLILNIAINLLVTQAGLSETGSKIVFQRSIFGVIFDSWTDIFNSVADSISNILDEVIQTGVLGKIIGFMGGSVVGIIAGIAMLFVMVRVFLMLLMSYIMIIILTMFAPFFFLIQALPGNNGAKNWFRQMLANVSVFPTVALMIIFAGLLGGLESLGGSGSTQFDATQIGQFPLLSGLMKADAIGKLIALGFLLATPTAAKMVKERIGIQAGPGIGAAAGAALGGAAGTIGRPFGAVTRPVGQLVSERAKVAMLGRFGYRSPYINAGRQPGQEEEQ